MEPFGSFEIQQEVYSGPVYTVYSARKIGDPRTEYAVKLFSIQQTNFDENAAQALSQLVNDLQRSCAERIAVQEQAAASSKFICPILQTGQDERGVWYATHHYPRSVNRIISGKVALTPDALEHIIRSIVQGALDVKRACGRSHGDILPSNVQISKSDKMTEAEVVLSDPLPGGAGEADLYEKADLQAIGKLIYQLVQKRLVDFQWVMVPLDKTPEWPQMLGKKATRWIDLCNRLLDPNLSLERVNLESVSEELKPSETAGKVVRATAIAAGVCLVVICAVFGISQLSNMKARKLEQRYRTAISEAVRALNTATNALNDTARDLNPDDFLAAKTNVTAAIKLRPGRAEAVQLQGQISAAITKAYEMLLFSAGSAYTNHLFERMTNQAVLALHLSPGSAEATSLLERGKREIERQKGATDCEGAKELARAAETNNSWSEALIKWQRGEKLCANDPEIGSGVAFASAMTNVLSKFKEARTHISGNMTNVRQATNLWGQVSRELPASELWSSNQIRVAAMTKLNLELEQLWSDAANRIVVLSKGQQCEDAKKLARKAEGLEPWSDTLAKWRAAEELCGSGSEIRGGITFASAMTNALSKLREAQTNILGNMANARQATNLWGQVSRELPASDLWSSNQTRAAAMTNLDLELQRLWSDAANRIVVLSKGQQCEDAKKLARKAEGLEPWSDTLAKWRNAETPCKGDTEVRNGITFASAMAEALSRLKEAQTNATGSMTNVQRATNLLGQISREAPAKSLERSQPRVAAIEKLETELKKLWSDATNRINDLVKGEECDKAKRLARVSETNNAWPEALTLWQRAKLVCGEDPEVSDGIGFATAITNANASIDRVGKTFTNSIAEAQQAASECEKAEGSLAMQAQRCTTAERTKALTGLSNDLNNIIGIADEFLARDFAGNCNYSKALTYCVRHKALDDEIRMEQSAYETMEKNFKEGEYGFLKDLKDADLDKKPQCFKDIVRSARDENQTYEELTAAQSVTNWSAVKTKLDNSSSAGLMQKKPFIELHNWAKKKQDGLIGQYDAQLVALADRFDLSNDRKYKENVNRLRRPGDKRASRLNYVQPKELDTHLKKAQQLQVAYGEGWLQKEGRGQLLTRLIDVIPEWNAGR